MSYDIYGGILRPGHCEVHPHVAEAYPCSVCYAERQAHEQRAHSQAAESAQAERILALELQLSEAVEIAESARKQNDALVAALREARRFADEVRDDFPVSSGLLIKHIDSALRAAGERS